MQALPDSSPIAYANVGTHKYESCIRACLESVNPVFLRLFFCIWCICWCWSSVAAQTNTGDQVSFWLQEGRTAIDSSDLSYAKECFYACIPELEATGRAEELGFAYLWLAEAYYQNSSYDTAALLGAKCETILNEQLGVDTVPYYLDFLETMGAFRSRLGDFDGQMAYYKTFQEAAIRLKGQKSAKAAAAYHCLGVAYGRRRQWRRSMVYLDSAKVIAEAVNATQDLSWIYNSLGYVATTQEDHGQAVDYYRYALQFAQGDEETVNAYNSLGMASLEYEDYESAQKYLRKSLRLFKEKADNPTHTRIVNLNLNIARAYLEEGQYESAQNFLDTAFCIISQQTIKNTDYERLAWHYSALLAYKQGDFLLARQNCLKALALEDRQLDIETPIYLSLGQVEKQLGEYDRSLEYLDRALDRVSTWSRDSSSTDNPVTEQFEDLLFGLRLTTVKANTLLEKARKSKGAKDRAAGLSDALAVFQLADSLVASANRRYQHQGSSILLAKNTRALYDGMVEAAYLRYQQAPDVAYLNMALQAMERQKAILMNKRLIDQRAKTIAGVDKSILETERNLTEDIEVYEMKLASVEEGTSQERTAWQDSIYACRSRVQNIRDRLAQKHPEYYRIQREENRFTVDSIRKSLIRLDEKYLEYHLHDTTAYAILIDQKNSPIFLRWQVSSDLDQLIMDCRTAMRSKTSMFYDYSFRLYQELVEPFQHLLGKSGLVISTDESIGYVPFNALVTEPVDSLMYDKHHQIPYFIRRGPVRHSLSPRLSARTPVRHRVHRILGIAPFAPAKTSDEMEVSGNLLPGSDRELNFLRTNYKGEYWSRAAASAQTFSDEAQSFGVLHVATHTQINNEKPGLSQLFFLNKAGREEALYARQIYNMGLSADLVVLSACNSGYGTVLDGVGISSLGWSFAYGGAPNLVLNLWPVYDGTTPELMTYFYEGMEKDQPIDMALHAAQLKYLDEGHSLFTHPYYWAGFRYVGKDAIINLKQKKEGKPRLWLALGCLFLLLLGRYLRVKSSSKAAA